MALMESEEKITKGDKAPDFTLKNIDGSEVSLSNFEGKPVAVIFMCNHCPYVKPKMQEIADLQNEITVLAINSNDPNYNEEDSFENMQKIAERFGYKYYLFDETQKIAKAYGAVCTPDPYLFNKDHELVYHGRINDAMSPDATPTQHDFLDNVKKMKAGEKIEDWFIPSMGCNIKWKD